jgi:hypothetical protein
MKDFRVLILNRVVLFISITLFAFHTSAQNVSVAGAVLGNGSYPDLNSAFAAINGGAQTNANISVNIVGNPSYSVPKLTSKANV